MIKYNLYSYFDKKAKCYTDIKICPNDEVAKRNFDIEMKNCKFSEDLQLFMLGSYDIETGVIFPNVEFLKDGESNA